MIAKVVRFSIEYRWLVILATFLVAIAGWYSFQALPIDAVPDITNVQVQVNTTVDALGPEEIERTVSLPIETALNGIQGVTQVRSITRFGISQVTVVFEDGTDIYRARQLVSERLQNLSSSLPKTAHSQLGPVSTGLGEIYHYILEAEKLEQGEARINQLMELRALQDWYVKPRLLNAKGVAEVNTLGGYERQYHINPDPEKMSRYAIHFSDIEEALEKVNQNVGGGYVEQTADQFLVQGNGLFTSIKDIEDVPVKSLENYKTISIGDIATVKIGKELRTGAALHNGNEVVLGTAMMLMGENSRTVSLNVAQKIEEIRLGLPKGYKIEPVYNRSELVDATLDTVKHNLITGALLVIIVLLLLIGNLRAALITAIVIPLSLLFTFILMKRYNISGNLISLGALDFGIIVDGAVIVLDNCVRHIHDQTKFLGRRLSKPELNEAIYQATVEIRKSAGFGEIIIIVVFLPIFAFVGIEGKMFGPMAATFIFAIFAALILSFTFVPALASLILRRGNVAEKEPWLMRVLSHIYMPVLNISLRVKWLVLVGAVASVVAGVLLFSRLGESSYLN
jgi:cobalt-zinc-cadmium resistance protein CzcA